MSYVDDFVHKLNDTAPKIKHLLTQIKRVDYVSQKEQVEIEKQKNAYLNKLKAWENKKQGNVKRQLQEQYKKIRRRDKLLLQYSKEKVQLAQKIYNSIHEPTQKLDRQLHLRGEKFAKIQIDGKGKKAKRKGRPLKEEWQNDPNEPKYCYCGKPSFGEMVMCENTYCDKEWFHRQCIDEKKLPEKWFCKDCRPKK